MRCDIVSSEVTSAGVRVGAGRFYRAPVFMQVRLLAELFAHLVRRCLVRCDMEVSGGLPASAVALLPTNVVFLEPEPAVFESMLEGWRIQQEARCLKPETIGPRLTLARRFAEFTNLYPWQWNSGEAEAFIAHLRSQRGGSIAVSTARGYEASIRLFCDYLVDPRYGWQVLCLDRFGDVPQQVFHEWNSVEHSSEFEGDPRRRPLTYDEIQALFDAADGMVEQIRSRGRKGALCALRDAILIKCVYAFGLRRNETRMLDLADFGSNPKVRAFGRFGTVAVRYAKSVRGGPPRRRTVLTVPEMDWVVPVLEEWVAEVRPAFVAGNHPAMWVTERAGRISGRSLNLAFNNARTAAGLPEHLDLHCLRHSYITHLIEFDYPQKFVQDQVGHRHASSTAVYTGVSDEYRNRLLQRSLQSRHPQLLEGPRS